MASPGMESTFWLLELSRCHCGVILNVTGQYEGFCQIGESLPLPN